jgi:thiamine-phosphate diphosphorylase
MFPFYFITEPVFKIESVVQAIAGGARLIQYRDKINTRHVMYENALRLRQITSQFCATLIINDQIDLAVAVCADGVHLGQDDLPISMARKTFGPKAIIGISTHTLAEALTAERDGASYIGFGPIFKTNTKENARPATGLTEIATISHNVNIPLVAIGGIEKMHLPAIFSAGADAVAAILAVSGDVESNVRDWIATISRIKK